MEVFNSEGDISANQGIDGLDEQEQEYYENPLEIIREFGTNPLMERAQKALTEQLKEAQFRLQGEKAEKAEELKRVTQEREALGVQLYGLQQQLARIQIMLENSHNEYNTIVDARLQEEEILRDISKNNSEQVALNEEYKKQQKKYAAELEALNETIRQIEKYSDEVKSEIAITRRATYKAEQTMQTLEKQKESQDLYVDELQKQLSDLKEQSQLYQKQLSAQSQETGDANAVLKDTIQELEKIGNEKKQLMIQWKNALSGLSRRDEALAAATLQLKVIESSVYDFDVKIESSKRDLHRGQAKHEGLVNLRDRLENELSWVEDNLQKTRQEQEQLEERYSLLTKSLAQTENESKKLDLVTKELKNNTDSSIQNLQVVTLERQKMEEDLELLHSTKSNVNKAVANLNKEQMKVLKQIHEKENEALEVENELARYKVERNNLSAVSDQLKEQLAVVEKEVKERDALTGKYQLEIRQRNDEVEKKMYRVDRLNKKYEKMVESAGGEENMGPLENTIKNLVKQIESTKEECKDLERDWLKKQTEMVTVSGECDDIGEKNGEQQARVTIITQQQLRLVKDLREIKNNLKESQHLNGELQKDVSKLNSLISNNHVEEDRLQASNFIIEMDCVETLKDAEKECIGLQTSITEAKTGKTGLLDEIIEQERQGLLWEKKIQLDKETREALDPSVGQAESDNMEKEIHRMELRFEALKREQERLSLEMERAIHKRASISIRYGKPKTVEKKGAAISRDLTQATAKKKIGALKSEARVLAEETSQYNSMFDAKKEKLNAVLTSLENVTSEYGESEELCHQLQSQINDLLYQRQLHQERIAYRQKYLTRLKDYSSQVGVGVDPSQSLQIERRVLAASQALDNVKEIITDLSEQFPHLKDVLSRVDAMTDPGINVEGGAAAQQ